MPNVISANNGPSLQCSVLASMLAIAQKTAKIKIKTLIKFDVIEKHSHLKMRRKVNLPSTQEKEEWD